MDNAAFQDNTNNTSMRCQWSTSTYSGLIYNNHDKDFYATIYDDYNIVSANFRPIIEYRE